jgi:hypothetical protein
VDAKFLKRGFTLIPPLADVSIKLTLNSSAFYYPSSVPI